MSSEKQATIVLKKRDSQETLEIIVTDKVYEKIARDLGAWRIVSASKG